MMLRKRTLVLIAAVPCLAVVALAGVIAFGVGKPPPPMTSVDGVAVEAAGRAPLPPLSRYLARDGAQLAYRAYRPAAPAAGAPVAVLIHGSGGSSANMNLVGRALAAAGTAAYAPDIRGHGASGRRGDIGYIGQLEDDLSDLVKVVHRDYPGSPIVLAGHSSGGGFTLRVAGEPSGRQFARFVLLAPYLGVRSPTTRPASGGWVAAYVPRIAGLTILNRFGVTAFNGLPSLAFAAEPGLPVRTWSYRLMENFGPPGITRLTGDSVRDAARHAAGPMSLLVGEKDESMVATAYSGFLAGVKPAVSVTVLPGVGHMGLLSDPRALPAVVQAIAGHPPAQQTRIVDADAP